MFYKRDMLIKMFSIDVTSSANRFQEQLEQTADVVIKRLEEQIIHLEYLLEEANEKITSLDNRIHIANLLIEKEKMNSNSDAIDLAMPDIMIEENKFGNSNGIPNIEKGMSETSSLSNTNYKDIVRSDKKSYVVEMADLGYDITEIAKTTGISKGEIMLLLQLNKK